MVGRKNLARDVASLRRLAARSVGRGWRLALCVAGVAAAVALHAAPASATLQFRERLVFRGEGGVAFMFPPFQVNTLGYTVGATGTFRFGLTLIDPLALQLSFGSWYFPSSSGAGQEWPLTLGLRFEPRLGEVGRLFVDANPGVGFGPDRIRFHFDLGVGFEFGLGRHVGLGPVVRYSHLFPAGTDNPSSAQMLMLGVSLAIRLGPERRPDGDDDGDTIANRNDECPDDPPGLHPDATRPGCPLPDRDHDNVPDADDACPDLTGSPSTDHSRNGCPGLVRLENNELRILEPIEFEHNSDQIRPDSERTLRALADAMRANPQIRRVSIDGHTDDTGADDVNLEMSQRRSESVRRWLEAHGVAGGRMEAHGFGETRPRVSGTTDAARTANRRVEFRIVDPAPRR